MQMLMSKIIQFLPFLLKLKKYIAKYFIIYTIIFKVSKNDHNKIIDGSLERLFFYEYIFALKPHHDPCVDQVGHSW